MVSLFSVITLDRKLPVVGGAPSISGFTYQKDYAAYCLLSSEAIRALQGASACEYIESFSIEGSPTDSGPIWDITWTSSLGNVHFRECKDTPITRQDRIDFYYRCRRALARGLDPSLVTIGWIANPGKQGNILSHLLSMRALKWNAKELPSHIPNSVHTAKDAIREAVYCLCSEPESVVGAQPLTIEQTEDLLTRFAIEPLLPDDLATAVGDLAGSLFERGVGTELRKLIQGEFDVAIQQFHQVRYSREEFLKRIGSGTIALTVASEYREILRFHSSVSCAPTVHGIKWARLPGTPQHIWPLAERMPGLDSSVSRVIVASTGVGKTTSIAQAVAEQLKLRPPLNILHFDACAVAQDTLKALPMLCLILAGQTSSWLSIDGLDEIPRPFTAWQQALQRLQKIPRLILLLTVRGEVVGTHEWVQELIASLGEVFLDVLTDQQVSDAFKKVGLPAPQNPSLATCLRNPFLFSLYATIVDHDTMPLKESGAVDAFNVIEAFWNRRVVTETHGVRGSGDPHASSVLKRAAVQYLVGKAITGTDVVAMDYSDLNVVHGIDMLCNEGALIRETPSGPVKWMHAWLREYAIVDYLRGLVSSPAPANLAEAVCGLAIDHVARDAANGACKWLVSRGSADAVKEFVVTLYEHRRSLAREVLFDLMDGNQHHLRLSDLPVAVLLEGIELAIQKRARQWSLQIAELPDHLFADALGPDLHRIVAEFEIKVTANG
jgi:hypothetical protein